MVEARSLRALMFVMASRTLRKNFYSTSLEQRAQSTVIALISLGQSFVGFLQNEEQTVKALLLGFLLLFKPDR